MSKGTGIFVVSKEREEDIEKLLKRFKKKIKKANLMLELSEKQFYTKKSTLKRQNKLKAMCRNKHKNEQMKELDNT